MKLAELVDLFVCSGCLSCELVARDIKDLKSLVMKLLIHSLDIFIVWCESAACCCVYYKHYLSLEVLH